MLRTAASCDQALAVPPPARRFPTDPLAAVPAGTRLPADAHLLDRIAVGLRTRLDRTQAPLVRAAADFTAAQTWKQFGYARLDDHARERLHLTGRWVRDLAAIGQATEVLDGLEDALNGADAGPPLSLAAARIIAARATPESVRDWLHLARTRSVRALREAAAREAAPPATAVEAGADATPGTAPGVGADAVSGTAPDAGANSAAPGTAPEAGAMATSGAASGLGAASRPAPAEAWAPTPRAAGDEPVTQVHLRLPVAVHAAYEEGRELHRAIEGREAETAGYVEALIAEAWSTWPELARSEAIGAGLRAGLQQRSRSRAGRERFLEQATRNWEHLRAADARAAAPCASPVTEQPRPSEEREQPDPEQRLRRLLSLRHEIEGELDRVLVAMARLRAWPSLRFAGLGHYAEERLGMSRSRAHERTRVCRRLEHHPDLGAACESGDIGLMAAIELVRLFDSRPGLPEAGRREWIDHARRITVKRLRDEIRAAGPADPEPAPMPDEAWHASLARRAGDARQRVATLAAAARRSVGRTCQHGRCDGPWDGSWDTLPMRSMTWSLPVDLAAAFRAAITHATRMTSAGSDPDTTRMTSAGIEAGMIRMTSAAGGHEEGRGAAEPDGDHRPGPPAGDRRAQSPPDWLGLLALVENFVATWDIDQAPQRPSRTAIYVRDGWRCMAPGCTSRRNLEDHHVLYRSRGGDDGLDNRVCLCRFHHQMGEHGELARVRGRAPLALQWSLGRGGRGGAWRNETRLFDRL